MKKTKFWLLIISVGILILIPPVIYFLNFSEINISESTSDWGAFGDFIGGITNTFISLLSLIILSYISWIISKSSTKENKNLFILQKRIEAFDKLSIFIPQLKLFAKSLSLKLDSIKSLINEINPNNKEETIGKLSEVSKMRSELKSEILFLYEYNFFLSNFVTRYNHIFKYDFESDNYKNLLKSSETICKTMDKSFSTSDQSDLLNSSAQEEFDSHGKKLYEFIMQLKKELE